MVSVVSTTWPYRHAAGGGLVEVISVVVVNGVSRRSTNRKAGGEFIRFLRYLLKRNNPPRRRRSVFRHCHELPAMPSIQPLPKKVSP